MDRRKALKNMGLAMGYTVATPTMISIMQSCKSEPSNLWVPEFFTVDEGGILTKIVDIILPKTETPSASEVNVDLFIDKFINEVLKKEEQNLVKMAMNKFMAKVLTNSKKETITDLTANDLEPVLAASLKISSEDRTTKLKLIKATRKALAAGKALALDDETLCYAYADKIRDLTILGYRTSEYIGEEVLAYLPVPGEYIGCGDTQELTGGKAWSL